MFWKSSCEFLIFDNQFGEFVKIVGLDIKTSEKYWVYIKHDEFLKLQIEKNFIEKNSNNYPKETLEFLINGNAPKYRCLITNKLKVSHNAYVTNASANSVVFYANQYLNNMDLSLTKIIKLRGKYSLGNLNAKYFTPNELRESFINQSAFFLNLYKNMNENDRFEDFVSGLDDDRFKKIFARYEDTKHVVKNYERRIFHDKFECISMRSNYNEGEFHANTGIFVEKKFVENFYIVEQNYLEKLNMRVCKNCKKENKEMFQIKI